MSGAVAAFDFDGTIFFDGGITPESIEAIKAWQAAGNLAVAATGKSQHEAAYAIADTGLVFDYSVLVTGAVVLDRHGKELVLETLDTALVGELVDYLITFPDANVYGIAATGHDLCFAEPHDTAATNIINDVHRVPPNQCRDQRLVGLATWTPGCPNTQAAIMEAMTSHRAVTATRNVEFVDILPYGVTKGSGLRHVLNDLASAPAKPAASAGPVAPDVPKRLYAFGDSYNDLSMFALADASFTFPWAPTDVQEAATFVVGSVAEGVARLCAAPPG